MRNVCGGALDKLNQIFDVGLVKTGCENKAVTAGFKVLF